jgi:hypothetical protein
MNHFSRLTKTPKGRLAPQNHKDRVASLQGREQGSPSCGDGAKAAGTLPLDLYDAEASERRGGARHIFGAVGERARSDHFG